jgi:hypothetical protein
MPCACQKNPKPELPTDTEWGPVLWTLLHGLAERSGRIMYINHRKDEALAWNKMMNILYYVLPCEECKGHYIQYIKDNPFPVLIEMPYENIRQAIREWLWKLHNNVNSRKTHNLTVSVVNEPLFDESMYAEEISFVPDVSSAQITIDCLTDLYSGVNIYKYFIGYKNIVSLYVKTPFVSILKWYQVEKHLIRLVSLYL